MFRKKITKIVSVNELYKENRLVRYTEFLLGVFMMAIAYNVFMKTTNAMYGVGGIAIVLLYPILIKLTEWMVPYVHLNDVETIVIVVSGAIITGIGLGLVFRAAFTTGGTDILNQIVSKYAKLSIGKAMIITDGLVIVIS